MNEQEGPADEGGGEEGAARDEPSGKEVVAGSTMMQMELDQFRSKVAERLTSVDIPFEETWRFFEYGPRGSGDVLVFLGDIAGQAECYFRQLYELGQLGYRVISVQYGAYWRHSEWLRGFDRFLDLQGVDRVHLFGAHLGGFLAQLFAEAFPQRVFSLILCNSFGDTNPFRSFTPWLLPWLPEFVLKRRILSVFPQGMLIGPVADSVDFMVGQVEQQGGTSLAARLTLLGTPRDIKQLRLTSKRVTVIDCVDDSGRTESVKDDLLRRYPEAHLALMKYGGPFPYIAVPDEVNLHIRLHLKRIGILPECDVAKTEKRLANAQAARSPGVSTSSKSAQRVPAARNPSPKTRPASPKPLSTGGARPAEGKRVLTAKRPPTAAAAARPPSVAVPSPQPETFDFLSSGAFGAESPGAENPFLEAGAVGRAAVVYSSETY